MATQMRERVRVETGVTCSCGIAPNSMLAKICSDLNKPDGQFALPSNNPGALVSFVATLPIRKVQGIGKVNNCSPPPERPCRYPAF